MKNKFDSMLTLYIEDLFFKASSHPKRKKLQTVNNSRLMNF